MFLLSIVIAFIVLVLLIIGLFVVIPYFMKILNNTHYFSINSRVYNNFPDTSSFAYESSVRNGYFQRLYFEHLYTQSVGGISFFYTLTYNDNSIPNYLGRSCFSYDDIRLVTNGKLSKWLKRQCGAKLRYFCACESGEGKGKRGLGNNPHYHFIFFVTPLDDNTKFHCPDPVSFRSLIRNIWQGSDSYQDYRKCKFGIAKEGNNLGVIDSTHGAFSYVGKYVLKDSADKENESILINYWRKVVLDAYLDDVAIQDYFNYYASIAGTDWFTPEEFREEYSIENYERFKADGHKRICFFDWLCQYNGDSGKIFATILDDWFYRVYVPYYIKVRLSEYRRNFSGKVRCSKSLGEYGLQFIQDEGFNPHFTISLGSQGYKVQRPCLYYIRKKYYSFKVCEHSGNPLYYLNDLGYQLKVNSLKSLIDSCINNVKESISFICDNHIGFSSVVDNTDLDCIINHEEYIPSSPELDWLNRFIHRSDCDEVIRRYAVYTYVYQYRHFSDSCYDMHLTAQCTYNEYIADYRIFLKSGIAYFDFNESYIYQFIHYSSNCLSYDSHIAFSKYIADFTKLSQIHNFVANLRSENKKYDYSQKSEYLKKWNAAKHNEH